MNRLLLLSVLLLAAFPALAQAPWPSKQIVLVVPFPPGGGPDVFARLLNEKLPARLGQPMIVENRPGVGGLEIGRAHV